MWRFLQRKDPGGEGDRTPTADAIWTQSMVVRRAQERVHWHQHSRRNAMQKLLCVCVITVVLGWVGNTMAQSHLLERGTKELGLSGTLDFEQESRVVLDVSGRFGYFLQQNLEVGGFAEVSSNFNEFSRYGLGGFAELHIPAWALMQGRTIPYAGADLGLQFVDTDLGEDNAALIFRPRIGLKWFVRDYFAIDTNVFVAVATDNIFPNKKNDLDSYDIGILLGLRIYFR
jgi:hypothetical protein